MQVRVRVAPHDGHGLGAGRAHLDEDSAQRLADRDGDGLRTGATHDEPDRSVVCRHRRRASGGVHESLGGQRDRARHRAAVVAHGHVHRPVVAADLAELPGAVDGIDDPGPP